MNVDLSINPSQVASKIETFLKKTLKKTGFNSVVIGLSGGIDSAVSCALAERVLGPTHIYPCLFPYGGLNQEGVNDGLLVMNHLQIPKSNVVNIDIKPIVDSILATDPSTDDIRKGNVMARVRMMLLFDQAKKKKALVMGTENKTEHLLGYFTRFGDQASDIEPIVHLYKTQVRALAKHLKISEKIISKEPSAGLWSGQTDEGEFGFTYEDADQVLNLSIDQKKIVEEIVRMGFSREMVEKVLTKMEKNRFKHDLPYHQSAK